MNTKSKLYGGTRLLAPGQALRLPRAGGELTVLRGRLWLTRNNDLGDHFIEAGQRVWLGAGETAVVEAAGRQQSASLHWEPCRQGFFIALLARPLTARLFWPCLPPALSWRWAALRQRAPDARAACMKPATAMPCSLHWNAAAWRGRSPSKTGSGKEKRPLRYRLGLLCATPTVAF